MAEVNLSDCKRMTCTGGGNILNYLQGTCEMRRCQGNDYMLSSDRGGWNIYVLDVARVNVTTTTGFPGNYAETTTVLPCSNTSGLGVVGWIWMDVIAICISILAGRIVY